MNTTRTKGTDQLILICPALHQTLQLMEHFFNDSRQKSAVWTGPDDAPESLKAEVLALDWLPDSTTIQKSIWAAYKSAIVYRLPTVWCCHRYQFSTRLFLAICRAARLHPRDIFDGFIAQQGLARLMRTAAIIRHAPLKLLDATEPASFPLYLATLSAQDEGSVVFCDWSLDDREQQAVAEITNRRKILFVCPEK